MIFVIVLLVCVVEVAFALYARNIITASAHEGARAIIEKGASEVDAPHVARAIVEQSAGGLVEDLRVGVSEHASDSVPRVTVTVLGRVKPFGPVPMPIEVVARATAAREVAAP